MRKAKKNKINVMDKERIEPRARKIATKLTKNHRRELVCIKDDKSMKLVIMKRERYNNNVGAWN